MTKRSFIVGVLLLVTLSVILLLRFEHEPEPVWRGKRLSQWLEGHTASSAANPPYGSPGWLEAEEAIKRIGTNGIPTLLRLIGETETGVKRRTMRLLSRQSVVSVPYRYSRSENEEALHAFEVLGASASNAVPELVRIYRKAASASSQMCAALALGEIGRPAEPALPALIENFDDPDGEVRFYAVSAVGRIGGDPKVVVPALALALRDTEMKTQWNAAVGLGSLGRRAASAVTNLLAARKMAQEKGHADFEIQINVALWRIAPEHTPKALSIENASPWIRDGVFIRGMDMQIENERNPIIPAGSVIPIFRQSWTSDPRGPIRLYLSADGDSNSELFLGEFEVDGLPPRPESIHAYVIAGIADGKIFICARNVSNNEFLEVRRSPVK